MCRRGDKVLDRNTDHSDREVPGHICALAGAKQTPIIRIDCSDPGKFGPKFGPGIPRLTEYVNCVAVCRIRSFYVIGPAQADQKPAPGIRLAMGHKNRIFSAVRCPACQAGQGSAGNDPATDQTSLRVLHPTGIDAAEPRRIQQESGFYFKGL